MDIKPDEKKVDNPTGQESLNDDQKKALLQAEEDRQKAEDLVKQEEEKEGQEKDSETIYQEKLVELEESETENRRKGAAIKEKNEQIQNLKKKIEEGTVLDEDSVNERLETLVNEKLELLQKDTSTKAAQALKIAEDNAVETKISKIANNKGEEKIIKFYFDNKVNKELPLTERINQALAQARYTLGEDKKFQDEIIKANESAIKANSKVNENGSTWSNEAKEFANLVLRTNEGKKHFEEIGKNNKANRR